MKRNNWLCESRVLNPSIVLITSSFQLSPAPPVQPWLHPIKTWQVCLQPITCKLTNCCHSAVISDENVLTQLSSICPTPSNSLLRGFQCSYPAAPFLIITSRGDFLYSGTILFLHCLWLFTPCPSVQFSINLILLTTFIDPPSSSIEFPLDQNQIVIWV